MPATPPPASNSDDFELTVAELLALVPGMGDILARDVEADVSLDDFSIGCSILAALKSLSIPERGIVLDALNERAPFERFDALKKLFKSTTRGSQLQISFACYILQALPSAARWIRDNRNKAQVGLILEFCFGSIEASFAPPVVPVDPSWVQTDSGRILPVRTALHLLLQLGCIGSVVVPRSGFIVHLPDALARGRRTLGPAFQNDLDLLEKILGAGHAQAVLELAQEGAEGEHRVWIECAAKNHGVGGPCATLPEGQGMEACSRCLTQRYCSVDHQRADWRSHKPFCRKPPP